MQTTDSVVQIADPGERGKEEHNRGDRFVVNVGNLFAWIFPILMIAIVAQVFLRSSGMNQAWLDDLQWWLYGASSLIAIAYAVTTDSHVRVDIFHENFSARGKNIVEIFALVWLFLPFILLAWDQTLHYAISSVQIGEGSDSPNGLHRLWILKVFMNLTFVVIGIAIWSAYVRNLARMTRPVLWKQLLYAFPSTMYIVDLVLYYAIWWGVRLTTPAEISDRDIAKSPILGAFEFGEQEMAHTVALAFVVTLGLIVIARLFDRGED
ncbi:TRAP transporter small permease subunit [Tropicimonas sp. IMCC6043]|uniref:TRAP transporter small permease subunit n=1 Tax=Tropicimonas sp. IMCC6043 TaxID=2510645 RepID=UPI00101C29AB|nr:TRAP transporter small permease subunit [Tropicimonas sp. IMCC6043]RYH12311.1 TRAP transporter small permease subunit [Tropicimonas sp. IMCC6043]